MTKAEIVAALREKTRVLYEGKLTPHRSCGIALGSTMMAPYRPISTCRSPCVPL
jgi:hypothetical protein